MGDGTTLHPCPGFSQVSLGAVCVRGLCPLPPTLGSSRAGSSPGSSGLSLQGTPSSPVHVCPGLPAALPSSANQPETHTRLQWSAPCAAEVSGWKGIGRQKEGKHKTPCQMLLLLESLAHPGPLRAPSLVEIRSQLTLRMMSGVRAKNRFHATSAARELPEAVSFSAWVSELKHRPKTYFQNSARDTCRTHAPL